MIRYTGGHGTSKTRADIIKSDGWKPGKGPVYAASGLYFWHVGEERAKEFALAWAEQQIEIYKRAGDADVSAVAIIVILETENDEVIDLTKPAAKHALDKLAQIAIQKPEGISALQHLQDRFISKMEEYANKTFKICIAGVPAPKKCKQLVYKFETPVLIVRHVSAIKETRF